MIAASPIERYIRSRRRSGSLHRHQQHPAGLGYPLPELIEASNPEAVFLAALPVIDRIISILGRRHGLADDDLEEFSSWVRTRMIEGEYVVFRKFGSRSSLDTYLSVVLANLLKDYRNSRWGRWRPSAMARRLGAVAIRLETMLYRDGASVLEAAQVFKGNGIAEEEIRSLASRIPVRVRTREVAIDAGVEATPAAVPADAQAEADADTTDSVVRAAIAELPAEDQIIVRMRFWDDFSVADIARTLGVEQKPLYRRLEAIQARLGLLLVARGVDRARVAAMLVREGTD
jgi:RNA polymerase sigma factor (sigma-70 family)